MTNVEIYCLVVLYFIPLLICLLWPLHEFKNIHGSDFVAAICPIANLIIALLYISQCLDEVGFH